MAKVFNKSLSHKKIAANFVDFGKFKLPICEIQLKKIGGKKTQQKYFIIAFAGVIIVMIS